MRCFFFSFYNNFLYTQQTPQKIRYISGNENPEKNFIFQKTPYISGTFQA